MLERQRVMNFRSKAMEGGNPKKPSPDSIDYGELAVGYHVLIFPFHNHNNTNIV